MKLYCTSLGQWAGTQADARLFKATHGVDFEQIDVPTDKPGLIEFLNRHEVGALEDLTCKGGSDEQPVPDVEPGGLDENEVIDFIFDKADGRAIERIFEALGTRFHEMRKAAQ